MKYDDDGFSPEDPSCWISPEGEVTYVGQSGSHSRAAKGLGDYKGGSDLEGEGYLHISFSSVMKGWDDKAQREIDPTQAQLDALFDIAVRVEQVLGQDELTFRRYMKFIADNDPKERT